MTPPRSIVDSFAGAYFKRSVWVRALIILCLLTICAFFALFPERYRAATTLSPSDPSSLGLGATLGQLGAVNSVFGEQAKIEVALRVARSSDVRRIVMRRLDLVKRLDLSGPIAADRWLTGHVDIRSLRGGIVQVETFNADSNFAAQLVTATSDATRQRLAEISRAQTSYKRDVLLQLVRDSGDRMNAAQSAYDSFRLRTRNTEPSYAIQTVTGRIETLRSAIKGKEVQLNAARQFATDNNISVAQILAEIDALKKQLSDAIATAPAAPESVGRVVSESKELRRLERELVIARSLYESYTRYLEGTAVEDLTSTANIRVLEPAYVDSARQLNLVPIALAVLIAMIALAMEFYRLRPPLGANLPVNRD